MSTSKLSKTSYFLPKSYSKTKKKTTPAYHSMRDFKSSILQCLFPYFLQIKCYKLLKWRLWFHRQFSRHFPSSCYPHSLAPAPATYSHLPHCSSSWTHTACFGSMWWTSPRLNPLSLPWKFTFNLGQLPVWWSYAELYSTREGAALRSQICTWQRLHQHTPVPWELFLNLQKHSHQIPQESKNKHTLHDKTGKGINFREYPKL